MGDENETTWRPDRKVLAAAIATVIVGAVQQFGGIDLFPGAEAAIAVIAAYLIPS